jgi:hypothetical protein
VVARRGGWPPAHAPHPRAHGDRRRDREPSRSRLASANADRRFRASTRAPTPAGGMSLNSSTMLHPPTNTGSELVETRLVLLGLREEVETGLFTVSRRDERQVARARTLPALRRMSGARTCVLSLVLGVARTIRPLRGGRSRTHRRSRVGWDRDRDRCAGVAEQGAGRGDRVRAGAAVLNGRGRTTPATCVAGSAPASPHAARNPTNSRSFCLPPVSSGSPSHSSSASKS